MVSSSQGRSQGGQPVTTIADERAPAEREEDLVMALLSEHVPLSLIFDISAPAGPDSRKILNEEGEPEDRWWEPRR